MRKEALETHPQGAHAGVRMGESEIPTGRNTGGAVGERSKKGDTSEGQTILLRFSVPELIHGDAQGTTEREGRKST